MSSLRLRLASIVGAGVILLASVPLVAQALNKPSSSSVPVQLGPQDISWQAFDPSAHIEHVQWVAWKKEAKARNAARYRRAAQEAATAHVAHNSPPAAPGSVQARVVAAWPGDDNWVVQTVACESGFDPYEVGGGGNNYYGLFQFGPWARAHFGNPLNMSVEQQVAAAWALIKASGSSQWSCSPYSYHP